MFDHIWQAGGRNATTGKGLLFQVIKKWKLKGEKNRFVNMVF